MKEFEVIHKNMHTKAGAHTRRVGFDVALKPQSVI